MDKSKLKVIAEITCSVVGEGTSVSKFIKAAVHGIDSFEGIRSMHHPMGTIIEGESIDQIFKVAKKAHEAIFAMGVHRLVTRLTIDDRRDKERVMEDKVTAVLD